MTQRQASPEPINALTRQKVAIGVWAIFFAEFVSLLFANARNIAQPGMIAEFDGMALFSWLIALPGLAGAAGTLLFGKLSDVYGRRNIILLSIAIFTIPEFSLDADVANKENEPNESIVSIEPSYSSLPRAASQTRRHGPRRGPRESVTAAVTFKRGLKAAPRTSPRTPSQ